MAQFALIVAIDDPGKSHVFRALKAIGISGNVIVSWKIDDPYGDDPGAYDRCAIAVKRNLIQLEKMLILNPKRF